MSVLTIVLVGLVLGFSLGAPPGPMNALIAARASRSWKDGVLTGLGAMTADAFLGAIVFLLQSVVDLSSFIEIIYVLGTAIMIVLAILLLREGPIEPGSTVPGLRTYSQALGIGLSNPFQIFWWLTAGIAFAYVGGAVLFAGLFGALAVWVVVFPWVVHSGIRRYPGAQRWVRIGSAALMLGFAGYFAYLAVVGLH